MGCTFTVCCCLLLSLVGFVNSVVYLLCYGLCYLILCWFCSLGGSGLCI